MIVLTGVGKSYNKGEAEVHALREIDLEVDPGEYLALLGPSGSGKSTLLHLIGCLDSPTAGRYRFEGNEVEKLDRNALAEVRNRRMGFVFQSFHLMPRLSALENVSLPLRFAGVSFRRRRARAGELLERVGLADRMSHVPAELSGGQKQRVAVARALANSPTVVLADEPTGNLDTVSGKEIIALLEACRDEGCTLLVVTHDETIAKRAQRVIRMLDGRIVRDA